MDTKKQLGVLGENTAALYLTERGYSIIMRNYRCKQGEIDIIARDDDTFIFVEVKARTSLAYGMAKESVNWHKQKKIRNCALWYLNQNNLDNANVRFDVIEIYFKKNQANQHINHLLGAF